MKINSNKLGLNNDSDIREVEYYLFNVKYHLIGEKINFNEDNIFNINFLEKIHIFLFCDIYEDEQVKIRNQVSEKVREDINKLLEELRYIVLNYDAKRFSEIIYKIWEYQIFYDGNTRTLLCYIKILSKIFDLKIDYDFKKDIYKDYFINEIVDCIYNEDEDKNIKC